MTISTSPLSYRDCYDMMDEALRDPKGTRHRINKPTYDASWAEANFLRMRMHQARSLHRKENERIFPSDHKMHGVSPYDVLTIRIKSVDNAVYVYIEQQALDVSKGEPLSELPEVEFSPTPQLPGESPMKQIEYKTVDGDSRSRVEISIPIKRRL